MRCTDCASWCRRIALEHQPVGSRPHLCVDLGRVRLRGLCHRRLRSQDPGLAVASTMATSMVLDAIEQAIWTRQQEGVLDLKDVAVGSRPHLCVDLGRVRLRGLCHRRLRSQDPGLRVASTMATSMVLDAIEQAIWTRQQEGVLDLKDVLWVADLTYVSTWAGFAYVAFVTDAYARRILGCGRFHDGHLHGPRRDRASHLDPPTRRRTRPERRCGRGRHYAERVLTSC